jgi:hypothetical protein
LIKKGTTNRLPLGADLENEKSFLFVGPLSTKKEKALALRAKLLGNQPGIK